MKNLLETTEKVIRKIISCRLLYYIAAMVLFAATYYIDLKVRLEEQNMLDGGNHLKYFLIASVISGIIILLLIIFSKKLYEKFKPHIVYFILAILLGGMYLFAIPLCAQSDEPAHMYRAFQVAQGEIIAPVTNGQFVTELPKSIVEMINVNSENKKREYKKYYDIKEMMQIELNEEQKVKLTTVGNYHGVSYLPQIIGLKTGMMLNLNPYYTAMLGRLTSLIITVLLLTLGIRKLPTHKLFASIVLLSPVVLSYAASFSADCMTLASVFLMLSYVLHYRHTKETIKKKDYFILAILTFIVAISKIAYLPVIGILIFIPKQCYKNIKVKWIISSLFIVFGIGVALWWMKTCNLDISGDVNNTNTWIYTNPIGYLIVLFRTTIGSCYSYLENMFAGHFLCHNQVNPYSIVPFVYIIITICSFFIDKNKEKTTMMQKLIVFGIIILSYVLISTAMYVYNTSFRNTIIIGVQGRYLVPLLLLAIFFGNSKKLDIEEHKLTNIALVANYAVYLAMMTEFFA